MDDTMLRFYVACAVQNKKDGEKAQQWITKKEQELRKTGLFEDIARFVNARDGKSFSFGLVAKNDDCLKKTERLKSPLKQSFTRCTRGMGTIVIVSGEFSVS